MLMNENNIPAGYKDSAVGIIPQEWEVNILENLGFFLRTNSLSRDKMNETKGSVRNIHYGDVLIKYQEILDVNKTDTPWINDDCNGQLGDYLTNGDLIISDTAEDYTVGKATEVIGLYNKKIVSGLHTMAFRPQPQIFASCYLGYYINSSIYRKQLFPLIQGIKVCSISKNGILNTSVCIPNIVEQQKIVEILKTWDEAIEKQSKLIKALEKRKRALMQRLLTGRVRLPGFTGEWVQKPLKELFSERIETNCSHLPLLSITADRGVILQSESDKKDNSNEDKLKYKRICPNDIGYNTMRMWQGRSALSQIEGIVSPAYTIVVPNTNVYPLFIAELLKRPRVVYDFWAHSQGLVSDTLNCKFPDFAQVKINLPLLEEQIAIAKVLVSADNEIKQHNTKLKQLCKQKQGLMQQLLTGKKRVKI